MKIIIGLGNPGSEYENTRHNAGFMAVDAVCAAFEASPFHPENQFHALVAQSGSGQQKCLFVKPLTYMNESARSIREIIAFYKIPLENILVLHDDIDLPLGTIRTTNNSSSAGQRGVKNIIDTFGSQDFHRVRIGVGPKPIIFDTADFVLGSFNPEELEKISKEVFPAVLAETKRFIESEK